MTTKQKWIPEGYNSVTPYLIVNNAAQAIEFYKRAFGATERMRMPTPDGKVGHAELEIGDSTIMVSDEFPDMDAIGPQPGSTPPVMLHVYVEDIDVTFKQALNSGGKEKTAIENKFYGDRSGCLTDPYGHIWFLATRVENLTDAQVAERAEKYFSTMPKK